MERLLLIIPTAVIAFLIIKTVIYTKGNLHYTGKIDKSRIKYFEYYDKADKYKYEKKIINDWNSRIVSRSSNHGFMLFDSYKQPSGFAIVERKDQFYIVRLNWKYNPLLNNNIGQYYSTDESKQLLGEGQYKQIKDAFMISKGLYFNL